jgi:ribonuclease BN (tRNA processing enzyme)
VRLTVLGASGGIGRDARTTALLLDDDVLLDAGTGVGDLPLAALARIDHVFLTHAHLDHHAALPLLLDTVGTARAAPLTVYGLAATLDAVQAHIFNDVIWPDFSRLPSAAAPFLRYQALEPGRPVPLGARRLRAVPVTHLIPAAGYVVEGPGGAFAFSGDTTVTEEFWHVVNATPGLKHLIMETSFSDAEAALARVSYHLCPSLLAGELNKLKAKPAIHITHLPPEHEDEVMREIQATTPGYHVRRLQRGTVLEI